MTTVVGLMRAAGGSQSATGELPSGKTAELEEFFSPYTKDLIVWGAPNVILSFQRFKTGAMGRSAVENLLAVDDILWAFRVDLGNSNRGLCRGDLIKILLRDPEKVDELLNGAH